MTPQCWTKAKKIASQALVIPPTDRPAFLTRVCDGDSALRACVDSFVVGDGGPDAFLEAPNTTVFDSIYSGLAGSNVLGQRVGAYRVTGVIAAGGMGTVYRAIRDDRVFHKDVAIKVIHRHLASAPMVRRFAQERQALATLEHPSITRLIDGGATDDGLPYFVMEFVEGTRLDRYCDSRCLSIADRLRLMQKVCDAVHYAHQNLIIHRDLKPSNILVAPDGTPKLLDFGIAKLLTNESTGVEATLTFVQALTPHYASPEQVRGDAVTTSSDVYSLGVVLYELLCGHRPYDLDSKSRYERERIVCESQPMAPSAVVDRFAEALGCLPDRPAAKRITPQAIADARSTSTKQLQRTLRGDLDTMILTALRKDPSRRYGSVQQFAEDLGRYLDRRPIVARKATLRYRTAKLIRRNKAMTGALTALVLAIVAGAVVGSVGLVRAREAQRQALEDRNTAQQAQATAQASAAFLEDMLSSANPYRKGRETTVQELLVDAADRIETELHDQPEVEAQVRYAIANTYAGMWQWQRALPHVRIAMRLFEAQHGRQHESVARCLSLMGRALTFARNPESVTLQREGLAIRRKLNGPEHPQVAESLGNLGYALWHGVSPPRWRASEKCYRDALAMYARVGQNHRSDEARFTFSLGVMLWDNRRFEDSEQMFKKSLAMYRERPTDTDSASTPSSRELKTADASPRTDSHERPIAEDRYAVECMRKYAGLLRELERYDEAASLLEESLAFIPNDDSLLVRQQTLLTLSKLRQAR